MQYNLIYITVKSLATVRNCSSSDGLVTHGQYLARSIIVTFQGNYFMTW